MPYNLKHLVHMPNTKQSEIHNSLASALFALFNSFFPLSNQWIDAIFLQSALEMATTLKYLSKARPFRVSFVVPSQDGCFGLRGLRTERRIPPAPRVYLRSMKILPSECWHCCSISTYAFWVIFLKPHKSRFPFGTFSAKFPLLSQLLAVPVRKQLLKHSSRKHTSLVSLF